MVQNPADRGDATVAKQEESIESFNDIKRLMGEGKKYLLCNEYADAVACFQDVCSLLSERYGQMSVECCEAYYFYGVSLLELGRLENGVLGNALKGVPDEDDSDKDDEQFEKPNLKETERNELRETVVDAMATDDDECAEDEKESARSEQLIKDKSSYGKRSNAEMKLESEESLSEEGPESGKPEASEKPCTSKESMENSSESEDVEDPDDIPNMQLAWEMLELSKVLYKKNEVDDDATLMVAQCHSKLGELGLEVENYNQAIEDFLECLAIHEKHSKKGDRRIASTYYNLGLAYTFSKNYQEALMYYDRAHLMLNERIELLEELVDGKSSEEVEIECREIREIKELLPDINSKIEDVHSLMKQEGLSFDFSSTSAKSVCETAIGFGESASSSSAPIACSIIPVRKMDSNSTCDISHLVRRKRTSADETNASDRNDAKKAKQDLEPKIKNISVTKQEEQIASKVFKVDKENIRIEQTEDACGSSSLENMAGSGSKEHAGNEDKLDLKRKDVEINSSDILKSKTAHLSQEP